MSKNELQQRLEYLKQVKLVKERNLAEYPHRIWTPYSNRDGSPSFQEKVLNDLENPDLKQIWVVAANSVGKTALISYIIAAFLNNDVKKDCKDLYIMTRTEQAQMGTVQKKLEEITRNPSFDWMPATNYYFNGEICADSKSRNSDKYIIVTHSNCIKLIQHRETGKSVTFVTANQEAKNLTGFRPDAGVIIDEPLDDIEKYNEMLVRCTMPRAQLIMTCTAVQVESQWILDRAKELLQNPQDYPHDVCYTGSMEDNPYADWKWLKTAKTTYTDEQYRLRVLGDITVREGLVLPKWEQCIVKPNFTHGQYPDHPIRPGDPLEPFTRGIVMDPGQGSEICLALFARIYHDGLIYIEDELVWGEDNHAYVDEWSDEIHMKMDELNYPIDYRKNKVRHYRMKSPANKGRVLTLRNTRGGGKPGMLIIDPYYIKQPHGKRMLQELAANKLFFQEAKEGRIEQGIQMLRSYMAHGNLKISNRCVQSIDMMRKWQVRQASSGASKRYNDSRYDAIGDCLRYLLTQVRSYPAYTRAAEDVAYQTGTKVEDLNKRILPSTRGKGL